MKLKDLEEKLKPDHLYLVRRDWDRGERYLLVYPIYDMDDTVIGWNRQKNTAVACFDDDIIVGSVKRIEERKEVRERVTEKFIKGLHITREQVGVRLPNHELCECGNPECDGQGNYRTPGTLTGTVPAGTGDRGGYAAQPTKDIEIIPHG